MFRSIGKSLEQQQIRGKIAVAFHGIQIMAHAMKFRAVVLGKTLPLPDLGAFEGKRVEVIVIEDDSPPTAPLPLQRPLGLLRGTFVVPDDFDAPLPPELQHYFEGDGDK